MSMPNHGRFMDDGHDSGEYQGRLRIPKGYTPPLDCRQSLVSNAEALKLEEMDDIIHDLESNSNEHNVSLAHSSTCRGTIHILVSSKRSHQVFNICIVDGMRVFLA